MNCNNCNAENQDNSKTCLECGESLTPNYPVKKTISPQRKKIMMVGIIAIVAIIIIVIVGTISTTRNEKSGEVKLVEKYSEGFIQIEENGKFGFMDNLGNIAVPCIYEELTDFEDGVAQGKLDGDWVSIENTLTGMEQYFDIDMNKYDKFHSFRNGFSDVYKDGLRGFVDTVGNEVVPLIYDDFYDFNDGFARVSIDDKWGFVNTKGEEVIPLIYDAVGYFSEGLAMVSKDGKCGVANTKGEEVIPLIYDYLGNYYNGFTKAMKDGKTGGIDENGNVVVPLIYDDVYFFTEGLLIVNNNLKGKLKYGFVDTEGNEVVPLIYDFAGCLTEGLAWVKEDGFYGVIDKNGNEVAPMIYDNADWFSEGHAIVAKDGFYGFIDKDGNEVVPLIYDRVYDFTEGLACVIKDGLSGFIDKDGNVVIPLIYDKISSCTGQFDNVSFSDGLARVEKDGIYGFIDKEGNEVVPLIYDYVTYGDFTEGFVVVGKDTDGDGDADKYGVVDKEGNEVVSLIYDDICSFSEGLARVEKDGLFGLVDSKGNEVVPLIYDYVDQYGLTEGFAKVGKDDKWGFIASPLLNNINGYEHLGSNLYGESGVNGFSDLQNYSGDIVVEFNSELNDFNKEYAKGYKYIGKNDRKAEKYLLKAFELQPTNPYVALKLIDTYEVRGKTKKLKLFITENDIDPEMLSISLLSSNGYEENIQIASELYTNGKVEASLYIYGGLIKQNPEDGRLYNAIADIAIIKGQLENAYMFLSAGYGITDDEKFHEKRMELLLDIEEGNSKLIEKGLEITRIVKEITRVEDKLNLIEDLYYPIENDFLLD